MHEAARKLNDYDLALAHDGAAQAGPTAWLEVLDGELTRRGIVGADRAEKAMGGYVIRAYHLLGLALEGLRRLQPAR